MTFNRNVESPPLTFRLLFRFFILGLLGLCIGQVLMFEGLSYSSVTMGSAIGNLGPANTFLLAIIFRMEKLEIKSSSSQAKLLGTITAISGAMVITFYQGPEILKTIISPDSSNNLLLLQPSDWIIGGLILIVAGVISSIWGVLQTATAREYPDQQTIVFFYCFFGMIQCIAISPFLEPNPSAWVLQPGIGMIVVVLGAVLTIPLNATAYTWCLEKKGPLYVAMFAPLQIVIALIMGITFLGDSLYLGSAIGATLIAAGFYSVLWGQAKEKNKLLLVEKHLDISGELGSSNQNTPLLSPINESKC